MLSQPKWPIELSDRFCHFVTKMIHRQSVWFAPASNVWFESIEWSPDLDLHPSAGRMYCVDMEAVPPPSPSSSFSSSWESTPLNGWMFDNLCWILHFKVHSVKAFRFRCIKLDPKWKGATKCSEICFGGQKLRGLTGTNLPNRFLSWWVRIRAKIGVDCSSEATSSTCTGIGLPPSHVKALCGRSIICFGILCRFARNPSMFEIPVLLIVTLWRKSKTCSS